MAKNIAASIRQKLTNLAKERGESFDFILRQYVIQRLLYRLSVSDYRDKFLLKGAMLFWVWYEELHRPTKDIDLLGFGDNDVESLVADFKSICEIEYQDGLIFDKDSITGLEIKEDAVYQGVRITGNAFLANAKVPIQVDIGFGDAVTPHPEIATLPTFLDMPTPEIRIYPAYTVIAEKFQAMIALGLVNSRMKDFYDIWILAQKIEVEGELLGRSIKATFERRKTEYADATPTALSSSFWNDHQKKNQWKAFLRKNKLSTEMALDELLKQLGLFLIPVYDEIKAGREFKKQWRAKQWKWVDT